MYTNDFAMHFNIYHDIVFLSIFPGDKEMYFYILNNNLYYILKLTIMGIVNNLNL